MARQLMRRTTTLDSRLPLGPCHAITRIERIVVLQLQDFRKFSGLMLHILRCQTHAANGPLEKGA
jgi:hypothetical protein